MNFTLPEDSLVRLNAQLNLTGTFNHVLRAPYSTLQVMLRLIVERSTEISAVTVEMGGQRHSITVYNNDHSRHMQVADFIDAIANGQVDSAEPAPARVTRMPVLPEPDELLSTDQLGRIKYMVRHGGSVALETGHDLPIHVAVHRTATSKGITAIVSTGNRRPRTSCFTVRGTDADCLKRLLASIEHTHIAATPRIAAAA
ncbi:hypothetical protein [Pseudomonas sp. TMP9]|uniref:hypothetical protein n=1 Tax=Pseudomonas sp. TMP9 TaxID=3133144 RepID=UPI0030CC8E32